MYQKQNIDYKFIKPLYLGTTWGSRNKIKTEILNISIIKYLDSHKITGIQKKILVRRVPMSLCTVTRHYFSVK